MVLSKGQDVRPYLIFLSFFTLYLGLAWLVSGGDYWWVIDYVDGQNIFFGDDAYRFFLARSAWSNPDLYTYNFVLPGQLFLDGIIIYLVDANLFLARGVHAFIGAMGLSLLYLCGCRLNLSRSVLLAALVIMGLLPRYALMSLSFYGEVWLGFFLVLAVFLFLRKNLLAVSLVASWLPLLRPEGIFFLAPIALCFSLQKKWKELLFLVLPGLVYFSYLCFSLPSLLDYVNWRAELRAILSKLDYQISDWKLFSLYSFLFTIPAVLALASPITKKIWPFLLGALIWISWFQFSIFQGLANFENRYSYALIPFVALLWAVFFNGESSVLFRCSSRPWMAFSRDALVLIVTFIVVGSHIIKTDNLVQATYRYGYNGTLQRIWQGRWDEIYSVHSRESIENRKRAAEKIEQIIVNDDGISNLSIYTNSLFYHLDPEKIPRHVTVGFLTNGYMVFHILLGGQSFIQHPGGKMYSYLDYGEPDFKPGEQRSLIVTIMPLEGYPYTWRWGSIEMYLFSYLASDSAKVDISEKPDITPAMLQRAYETWYRR